MHIDKFLIQHDIEIHCDSQSLILLHSIVTFNDVYVSYVTPKTDYDNSTKSYYVTSTICLIIPKPGSFNVTVETLLSSTTTPVIEEVRCKITCQE